MFARTKTEQKFLLGKIYNIIVRPKCYLAVTPNPTAYGPLKPIAGSPHYLLKFGDGPKERDKAYAVTNPAYNLAHNDGQGRHGKELEKAVLQPISDSAPQGDHIRSEWYKVIDTGKKNSKGQTLQDVLNEILEAFPNYDLETEERRQKAIDEMSAKLQEVAAVEEASPRPSFSSEVVEKH